ncbi:MAG: hypothetical protein NTU83_11830 [Candidatus Hydrogenedentes bacterium]|nr:hypothetical protein [Candidatus Hydrogenedentota bacterium]
MELVILCAAAVNAVLGAGDYSDNDAENSRLATVYSLAKYGTWHIDRPANEKAIPFEQGTIDKVMVNGHLLSSKPPMLTLWMTGEYLFLDRAFGWDLDDDNSLDKLIRFMTITIVGGSYVLVGIFFAKTQRLFKTDALTRALLLFCVLFCTQLWGYATHLNNHVPATAMLMIALYFGIGLAKGRLAPRLWRFAIFGLAAGLVPTLDMPATIFAAFAGFFLLVKFPARTVFIAGAVAAVALIIHAGAMWNATDNLLPVQMRDDVYLYEGSYWRNPQGIDALNEPKGTYLFHMTLGRCGLFSLYPVLLAGMAATVRALAKPRMPNRGLVLAGAVAFVILTAYYVFKTNNYGGEAYGFRWYIVAMPVLLLMSESIFETMRARSKWIFAGLMIGVSFYSALECARNPWGANRQWTCRLFLGPSYGVVWPENDK